MEIQNLPMLDQHSKLELIRLKKEINQLHRDEDQYWVQRVKVNWLQAGDLNTKFFHAQASSRRKNNSILGFFDEDGRWHTQFESIDEIVNSYFELLFRSSGPRDLDFICHGWTKKVSSRQWTMLNQHYSRSEIDNALNQMCPLKAPGPDGLPPGFFSEILT